MTLGQKIIVGIGCVMIGMAVALLLILGLLWAVT